MDRSSASSPQSAQPAATSDPSLLTLERVSKSYGRRWALREVSLSLERGSCVVLLGPNGAGKTTLLRVAATIAKPTSGRLLFEERPIDPARVRSRVGFMGHQTLLYDALTARQNLVFFARLHGVVAADRRADELLRLVHLERHADRLVGSFSRGMQQRLALARVMIHEPTLVLLDEPATGLDRAGVLLLLDVLRRFKEGGATVLLATHLVDPPLELADTFAILAEGELVGHVRRHEVPAAGLAAFYERALAHVASGA